MINLNFLARHFKQYPVPVVLEDLSCPCSGYFQWPEINSVLINGKEHYLPFGAIVFNPREAKDDQDLCNTIAHEYRHFLQFCVIGGTWSVPSWDDYDALGRYWTNHPCEQDAYSFASSLFPHPYYDDFCKSNNIRIMSRSESLLLPKL